MNRLLTIGALSVLLGACAAGPDAPHEDAGGDAGAVDAGPDAGTENDGGVDAGVNDDGGIDAGCFITTTGVFGECVDSAVCSAMSGYSPTAGFCPGPVNIQCCSETPNVANNPPVPMGWKLMMQSEVTTAMTTWAVMILHDPASYPMFSSTMMVFGTLTVMARVEWHPPDFQNNSIHRGVTLYEPG